jgi:predicted nucleic-acid-binding protein
MTAVDTNVLVRILTNDDVSQSRLATTFMRKQDRVYLLKTVLPEIEWVLRSSYGFAREAIVLGFRDLLKAANLDVEDPNAVTKAIDWFEQGMDFADALHLASIDRETEFATFDVSLRRTAERLGIGKVVSI